MQTNNQMSSLLNFELLSKKQKQLKSFEYSIILDLKLSDFLKLYVRTFLVK